MRSDQYGQTVLTADDAFTALYSGKLANLEKILIDSNIDLDKFNKAVKLNYDSFSQIIPYQEETDSIEFFDEANQCTWFMPEEYQKFPIHQWLIDQCKTEEERTRVDEELTLFIQHGMFDLLFYLKYLVDTMRANQIVWGVGRGSSVASYVLYLLGIHKVDSIKYKLDIHEFLK
jgi:DNA polymerase III alpha subunit